MTKKLFGTMCSWVFTTSVCMMPLMSGCAKKRGAITIDPSVITVPGSSLTSIVSGLLSEASSSAHENQLDAISDGDFALCIAHGAMYAVSTKAAEGVRNAETIEVGPGDLEIDVSICAPLLLTSAIDGGTAMSPIVETLFSAGTQIVLATFEESAASFLEDDCEAHARVSAWLQWLQGATDPVIAYLQTPEGTPVIPALEPDYDSCEED